MHGDWTMLYGYGNVTGVSHNYSEPAIGGVYYGCGGIIEADLYVFGGSIVGGMWLVFC